MKPRVGSLSNPRHPCGRLKAQNTSGILVHQFDVHPTQFVVTLTCRIGPITGVPFHSIHVLRQRRMPADSLANVTVGLVVGLVIAAVAARMLAQCC
jgi:hypothetical protein